MPDNQFHIKIEGLSDVLSSMSKSVRKAARTTITEFVKQSKIEASAEIREKYNIKKADLEKHMKVKLPTYADLTGEILVYGNPIPLVYFGATEVRDVRGGVAIQSTTRGRVQRRSSAARGVTYEIEKGKKNNLPDAFMAYSDKWGRVEVFRRQRKGDKRVARLPIFTFRSISIPSMFNQERVVGEITKRINARFEGRFAHHLNYFLERES